MKRGVKRKDIYKEKKDKANAKRARSSISSSNQNLTCKSCKNMGHSSARTKECPNHNFTLKELLNRNLGFNYQRYTVSLPLKSFVSAANQNVYVQNFPIQYVSDAVLSHEIQPAMDGNIAFSLNEKAQDNIRALSKPLILEIRNRLPSFPMTKINSQ
ncbi:uncharacterized protein BX663DRAFT_175972 [Cokeromyces recurvatus]|uniref:uncharacterized protein n=1 Tax=Cokeromyces recurvatus TaxID=90255 RepID=UPI00221E477B|nr:uncharacterized protein BX663DRAFT_175972 [Cokeromyces recurvatus]KAI7899840.1 hypothetical protein BX663DRAFT_175972 [Cokeromyces recurvatus]